MHITQKTFLKRLKLKDGLSYSKLTRNYNNDNNVVFHLKQLVRKKLIYKQHNKYYLTSIGVRIASKLHLPTLKKRAPKVFVIGFLCEYENHILIKKHVNKNSLFYKFPAGRPFFGEDIKKSLIRIFHEISSVKLTSNHFTYDSLHLMTIKNSAKDIIIDDALGIYKVSVTKNKFTQIRLENGLIWVDKNKINKLEGRWPEIDICVFKKGWRPYLTYHFSSNYIQNSSSELDFL